MAMAIILAIMEHEVDIGGFGSDYEDCNKS